MISAEIRPPEVSGEKVEGRENLQGRGIKKPVRRLLGMAVLILLAGLLISAFLFKRSGATLYPTLIADAYREAQHHLTVPGAREVNLTRSGAYGIYYESGFVAAVFDPRMKQPPAIECSLTSQSTGVKIAAVPDYVETNRYWSREQGGLGVLIMSATVDEPGDYTFACDFLDRRVEPEIEVALGPNYFWEFFRIAGKIGLPLLSGIGVLCGSFMLAILLLLAGFLTVLSAGRVRNLEPGTASD